MRLSLRVVSGSAAGLVYELAEPGSVLIGRSARAGLKLPSGAEGDLRVSHTHALIEFNPPICRVHDLESRNGTWLKSMKVTTSDLNDGDELKVGRTQILVGIKQPSEDTAQLSPEPPDDTFDRSTLTPVAAPHVVQKAPSVSQQKKVFCRACQKMPTVPGQLLCIVCEKSSSGIPQNVPGHRLIQEIGRGAMGVVYMALSEKDASRVAVKTILIAQTVRPQQTTRFLREAEILSRLIHPNIVQFRSSGKIEGAAYLAMDYVNGMDLKQVLTRSGAMSVRGAVRAVRQALLGLAHAHQLGFVHRDLKPSNLMLELQGKQQVVKVTDFGLARAYHTSQLSGLTLAGDVGGTPAYLPPEQILNFREAAPTADQYSMAATLYTLLTNTYIHDCDGTPATVLARILDEEPIPIRDRLPGVPVKLAKIIHRAMSREPSDRFASVEEFRVALEPFSVGK